MLRNILTELSRDLSEVDLSLIERSLTASESAGGNIMNERDVKQLALVCQDKSLISPEWGLLSGRLQTIEVRHKVPKTFSEATRCLKPLLLENYVEFVMNSSSALDAMIDPSRDLLFDSFGINTLKKSYLAMLKVDGQSKIVESPQYMYLRVATYLWYPDLPKIEETYRALSLGEYSHASPTLFNAGMKRHQFSSCFLLAVGDSMPALSKSWHDCAIISMNSGGIGCDYSEVRHSEIGQHGYSRGIIPWLKIKNEVLCSVDQAGRRKGSGAMYLCDWHVDIQEFVELRKTTGPDDLRVKDLFLAVCVSDLFMKRVMEGGMWSLFCPNKAKGLVDKWGLDFEMLYLTYEKKGAYSKQVPARDVWKKIISCQTETGMPYMLFKDSVNACSNQRNLGTIRQSNLCVSGDTMVLTNTGHYPIVDLVDQKVTVWNGEEWSEVIVKKTGSHENLVRVELSNGVHIDCTPEHKFYLQKGYWTKKPEEVCAKDLKEGAKLIKWELPETIDWHVGSKEDNFKYPYTHGVFCGDGTTYDNYSKTLKYPKVALYGEKKDLLQYLDYECYSDGSADGTYQVTLPKDLRAKFEVPLDAVAKNRMRWFEGYCDTDGTIARNGTNESLQISSVEKDFLLKVRLLLQTLGVESKVTLSLEERKAMLPDGNGGQKEYNCKPLWRLLVTSNGLYHLVEHGFSPKRLKFEKRIPQRDATHFVTVTSVTEGPQDVDTYCFTEPKRHMGMFNGVLTGQCIEVVEYTSPDEIASCTLASVCLSKCIDKNGKFDFAKLETLTAALVRNLNQVIDRNYYPDDVPQIKYSNMRHRPLGIGVQDLAGTFALLDIPWVINNPAYDPKEPDSKYILNPDASKLNKDIAETMYFAAIQESIKLAKEQGHYETFPGSPASKGMFQFDLWTSRQTARELSSPCEVDLDKLKRIVSKPPRPSRYSSAQWETLRNAMMKYGLRNSLLIAYMPTASSAQILGNAESFEPFNNNFYARTVLSGQYMIVNKHLVRDMRKIGLWNTETVKNIIINRGSIQRLPEPKDGELAARLLFLKRKYLTVFEIPQMAVLQLSIERGPYICQTQSLNCHMSRPTANKLHAWHMMGWKNGLKTGMYYLRQEALSDPINIAGASLSIPEAAKAKKKNVVCTDEICTACQ